MRHVRLLARFPGGDPSEAFERIIDFEKYPDLVDPVRTIEIDRTSDADFDSRWSVIFRKGILNWSEKDHIARDTLTLTFEQDEGDFDVLTGAYRVVPTADGCDIFMESTFDFGVSSIESIVEPIAARVIKENFELILIGLLGPTVFFPANEQPDETVHTQYTVLDYATPDAAVAQQGAVAS
ncbi:SRPBCC family protein [Streptomyces sp. ME19-01-6]|uniref:SRPBCC family protein n=1 Tax=Streptomyces sp. ME19-01-6 TaxID=3028686 RepID=UPI0029AA01F4|nr:SRPBCC family protein [Streptomyces sp. ME19-01-6]MDX3225014.1 SRPBCC family protein [Streptomyces sp. ME19-01-6]